MKKSPAFQFYAAEYLSDENVTLMTIEEEGVYIRLLSYCWREGSIPSDEELLSRLAKGASSSAVRVVKQRFYQSETDPTRMLHGRLEKEREKQRIWSEKSSEGGKRSSEKRYSKEKKDDSKGGGKGGSTFQSSSSSSSSSSAVSSETDNALLARAKKLMGIRDTTPLDAGAEKAWKVARRILPHTSEEDWLLLEWWFGLPQSPATEYRKTNFAALLNNWSSEINKAKKAKSSSTNTQNEPQHRADKRSREFEQSISVPDL